MSRASHALLGVCSTYRDLGPPPFSIGLSIELPAQWSRNSNKKAARLRS
jgi:hypothetical protein